MYNSYYDFSTEGNDAVYYDYLNYRHNIGYLYLGQSEYAEKYYGYVGSSWVDPTT